MNTSNIEAVFVDYLKTPNTQYALLLNGSWGSGKTYFWKYKLQETAKANGYETIYLSLNGISKIDTLEYQLFLRLLPLVGKTENKATKAIVSVVANLANAASKKFLSIGLSEALQDVKVDSLSLSNHIICFDDLERCQLPIKETLGFINNYVEHKNLKALILADEKNIEANLEKDNKKYNDIKEKVVGRILNYEPDISQIIPLFFKKFESSNNSVYNFFEKWKTEVISILNEYREDNLRIISFYIHVLGKVSPFLENVDEKYVREVILFAAIISIEFKRGRLTTSDYSNPKDIQNIDEHFYSLLIARTSNLSEEEKNRREKKYSQLFYERYLTNRINQYYFYPSIYAFILTGYFNSQQFQDELRERHPVELSDEIKAFRLLLDYKFRQLSNTDFTELTTKVLNYAREGKYSIYDYTQIANFYFFFSDNHLLPISHEDIMKVVTEGLSIAKQRKQIEDRILENLLHFASGTIEVQRVKAMVKDIHDEIKREQYAKESDEFLKILQEGDEYQLAELFQKHQFSKELFQFATSQRLFDTLVLTSNKQLFNFTELLKNRYTSINIGEFLFVDYDYLKTLKEMFEQLLLNSQQEQPRKFLIETLIKDLEEICDKLLTTKK